MPKICLCLTGSTIAQDLEALERYRDKVDMVELRADYLDPSELFHLRAFPEKAGMPSILTVRRKTDGGKFDLGEGVRLVTFARGLAFADSDRRKNFSYVDIEHDFHIPSIQEAARTFGTKIIRSKHCLDGMPADIDKVWRELSSRPSEIPKLAVRANGMADVDSVFRLFEGGAGRGERVVVSMGEYGFCTRVLADRLGSMLVYASAAGAGLEAPAPGQLDPSQLLETYRARDFDRDWSLYGILGGPAVIHSLSPIIHNAGFSALGLRSLYLPFPSDDVGSFLSLADRLGVRGFSITVPFKERVLPFLSRRSAEVEAIGACNTAIKDGSEWVGYNTDAYGFSSDVRRFLGVDSMKGLRATIVGAGGAAKAAAYALNSLGAKVCVVNRSMSKARRLAEAYGFEWSGMTERAADLMERYNDLIVQTTSVGLEGGQDGDPIEWYEFSGREALYEAIYSPPETPVMRRARRAGCRVANGLGMLYAQAEAQFSLFSGHDYPKGGPSCPIPTAQPS
ncbi:MAG: type I 3-dehydroquinate dehydratase [Spirochaetaceae bacterium]|nr:type I 3-dehydroquinate dehydratase [Spirochaetaceae bacterium]